MYAKLLNSSACFVCRSNTRFRCVLIKAGVNLERELIYSSARTRLRCVCINVTVTAYKKLQPRFQGVCMCGTEPVVPFSLENNEAFLGFCRERGAFTLSVSNYDKKVFYVRRDDCIFITMKCVNTKDAAMFLTLSY